MLALNVPHRCGLASGNSAEIRQVLTGGEEIEPLRHLVGRYLEQMLVQCATPAIPDFNFERTRPREQHVPIDNHILGLDLRACLVCSIRISSTQLRDLDDRKELGFAFRRKFL